MSRKIEKWAAGRTERGMLTLYFKELDSTNDFAMELSESCPHGTVVIADTQKKGKGRMGRRWESPDEDNIYMSVLLKPGVKPKDITLLTLAGAVAAAKAIKKLTGVGVRIKWPNDLMASGKKLGGILLESRSSAKSFFAVMGMGINVNAAPSEMNAVSIKAETGAKTDRIPLIEGILDGLEAELETLRKDRSRILTRWRRLSSTLGREVRVTTRKEVFSGMAEDIDEDGRLIVRMPDGQVRAISSGDVMELR